MKLNAIAIQLIDIRATLQVLLKDRVDKDNVLILLTEALSLEVDVLIIVCCRVIAENLADLINDPMLASLAHESAASIQDREDVDSVPIIDDILYHLDQIFPTNIEGMFLFL